MPFAIFEDKALQTYGIMKIKGKFLEDKLVMSHEQITKLIKEHGVDIVVLEDVFLGKNFTGTKSTLQTIGVLRHAAYLQNAICFLVPASKWRKGVIKKNRRESMKEQAVNYVNEMYDLDLEFHKSRTKTDDDIAEAIIMTEGLVWNRYTVENVKVFKDKKVVG